MIPCSEQQLEGRGQGGLGRESTSARSKDGLNLAEMYTPCMELIACVAHLAVFSNLLQQCLFFCTLITVLELGYKFNLRFCILNFKFTDFFQGKKNCISMYLLFLYLSSTI